MIDNFVGFRQIPPLENRASAFTKAYERGLAAVFVTAGGLNFSLVLFAKKQ
jgi:hypothetical protein